MTGSNDEAPQSRDFSFLNETAKPENGTSENSTPPTFSPDAVSSSRSRPASTSKAVSIYAAAVTALLIGLIVSGRVSLIGTSKLESLPDLKPLDQNEFQRIPDGTPLPDGHVLKLGESRRFGDVVVTPVKLTREPLRFTHFLSGKAEDRMTTEPVLKLWLSFQNVAEDYGFSPIGVEHISHRSPPTGDDAATLANSYLLVGASDVHEEPQRFLNFLHAPDSNFLIQDQNTNQIVFPGKTLTVFVPCSEDFTEAQLADVSSCVWRIQFRKGVHLQSGHGVTTLIDVPFSPSEISTTYETQL